MELDFDNNFKLSVRALYINNMHPSVTRDTKWVIQLLPSCSIYSIVFSLLIYNILFENVKDNDFEQLCKNSSIGILCIDVAAMSAVLISKRTYLMELMDFMKKDFELAKLLPATEQEIVVKFAKKGVIVCKQWLVISILGPGLFLVKNVALITFYWVKDGEIYLIPYYDLVFPSFIEDRKAENVAVYAFTYLLFLVFGLQISISYMGFVPLGPIFMMHTCGQLQLIKCRIKELFTTADVKENMRKLKNIVKQLQYIYKFVDRINVCFKEVYDIILKATTLTIPVACYQIVEVLKRGEINLEFFTFLAGGILYCMSACFYSDLMMVKGEEVRLAIYTSVWEKVYDRGLRNSITIVLQRSYRPVAVRTMFRTLSRAAFTDLCQQSYTIFNLINAAWK